MSALTNVRKAHSRRKVGAGPPFARLVATISPLVQKLSFCTWKVESYKTKNKGRKHPSAQI